MSYKAIFEANNADLQTILDTVNALPEAGGSGGIVPTGTKKITENGTYDVASYANAEVNVPEKTPVTTELTVTANGTYTPDSGVDGYSKVTVNVPSSGGGGGAETCTVTITSGYAVTNTGTISRYTPYIYEIAYIDAQGVLNAHVPPAKVGSAAPADYVVELEVRVGSYLLVNAGRFGTPAGGVAELDLPASDTANTYYRVTADGAVTVLG